MSLRTDVLNNEICVGRLNLNSDVSYLNSRFKQAFKICKQWTFEGLDSFHVCARDFADARIDSMGIVITLIQTANVVCLQTGVGQGES